MPLPAAPKVKESTAADASESHTTLTRPDKKAYDAEQEKIKAEIDSLQVKLSAAKEQISQASKGGPAQDRRNQLRQELDTLRATQATFKQPRTELRAKIAASDETIERKVKELKAAQAKLPYKNVADVDTQIKNLEKQVESGSMKLVDEKRALQEISLLKRNRRTVESFQADQDSIEADRQAVADLKRQFEDPEYRAVNDKYDSIKKELDELKKEESSLHLDRSKLFSQRDELQQQINTLYGQKRESAQKHKEANDRYWTKVNEDRARRAEKHAAQRAAAEAQKRQEKAEELLDLAKIPAYQNDIEDCQTLIDYFSGRTTGTVSLKTVKSEEGSNLPKLEIRQVEPASQEGLIVRKKKGEDEETYFVGGKGKAKGKKGPTKTDGTEQTPSSSAQLSVPFGILSALLNLSIPPPSSSADISRVTKDLETKKDWFLANQAKVTADNIAKAEAEIKRLGGDKVATPANGDAVKEKATEVIANTICFH